MIYAYTVIFLKLQTIIFSIVQFTATNVYNHSATLGVCIPVTSFFLETLRLRIQKTIVNAVHHFIKNSKRFTP